MGPVARSECPSQRLRLKALPRLGINATPQKKDAMAKDTMAKDAMAKDAMKKDAMGKGGMDMANLSISSQGIDLGKHIGHKVSVTGTEDSMHAFTVTSLKMIAATCGK